MMEVQHDDLSPCSRFDDLPTGITRNIIEKLPVDSLACWKLLNKSFHIIIEDQDFAIDLFLNAANKNPFIFISFEKSFYFVNMDSVVPDEFKKINTPFQLPNVYIIGPYNGYLCLSFSSAPIRSSRDRLYPWGRSDLHDEVTFIRNPFTSHFIELPLPLKRCPVKYGFGFNRLTIEYKVVKIYLIRDSLGIAKTGYMQIFTMGRTNHWRTLKAPSNLDSGSAMRSNNRGVCVNGVMYWFGRNDNNNLVVLALDLTTEEFAEIRAPYDMNYTVFQSLTELRGCFAILAFPNDYLEIWILNDSWTLQGLIGNYADKSSRWMQMKIEGEVLTTVGVYHLNHGVCPLEDDKLLMYFVHGVILCYDFETEDFEDFKVRGLPKFRGYPDEYEAITLVGSLTCID